MLYLFLLPGVAGFEERDPRDVFFSFSFFFKTIFFLSLLLEGPRFLVFERAQGGKRGFKTFGCSLLLKNAEIPILWLLSRRHEKSDDRSDRKRSKRTAPAEEQASAADERGSAAETVVKVEVEEPAEE